MGCDHGKTGKEKARGEEYDSKGPSSKKAVAAGAKGPVAGGTERGAFGGEGLSEKRGAISGWREALQGWDSSSWCSSER